MAPLEVDRIVTKFLEYMNNAKSSMKTIRILEKDIQAYQDKMQEAEAHNRLHQYL